MSLTLLILYFIIMILWVAFAAGAKRCHDLEKKRLVAIDTILLYRFNV